MINNSNKIKFPSTLLRVKGKTNKKKEQETKNGFLFAPFLYFLTFLTT